VGFGDLAFFAACGSFGDGCGFGAPGGFDTFCGGCAGSLLGLSECATHGRVGVFGLVVEGCLSGVTSG
jgi:hypothetical protein